MMYENVLHCEIYNDVSVVTVTFCKLSAVDNHSVSSPSTECIFGFWLIISSSQTIEPVDGSVYYSIRL